MRDHGFDGARAIMGDDDSLGLRIVGVDANACGKCRDARGPLWHRDGGKVAVCLEHRQRFAV